MKKLLLFILFSSAIILNAQYWSNVGSAGFSPGQANYTSLAINDITPYVAFSDLANSGKATLMKYDGQNWVYVGSPGFSEGTAEYVSLAFNGTTPYVAYQDFGNSGKATVMKYDGQNWINVGLPGFSAGGAYYTNLSFNESIPYVSYMDEFHSSKVSVMKFDGSNWVHVGSPGFSAGRVYYIPLAFCGSTPYVAYRDLANANKATVMKYDGQNWVPVGSPGFTTNEADYLSIAFNGTTPYISFEDYSYSTKASVMKFDGTNWVYVGSPGFTGGWTCFTNLAFYGTTPYIAYWDGANSFKASVMKYDGQNWVYVGTPGFSAGKTYYNTFALAGSTLYVAYQDYANSYKATVMKFNESPTETYEVNLSSDPINGGALSGANTYYAGTQVKLSVIESAGFSFAYWSENGNIVSYNKNYTFIINSNRNLVAHFNPIQFSVAVSVNPSKGGMVTGDGIYNYGSTVNLRATFNVGYKFLNWSENGNVVSNSSNYTFTIYSDRTLVANFELLQYSVSASVDPSNAGSITGEGKYDHGSKVTMTADPDTGFQFSYWSENGNIVSYNQNYNFTINSDRNLVAHFTLAQFSISVDINPPNSGTITGDGIYNYGSTVNLKATPNTGYKFLNWSESGDVVSSDSNYSFPVYSNSYLIAHFLMMPGTPKANNANSITQTGFVANWDLVVGAEGYYLDVALDNQFNNILSKYNNVKVGNVNSYSVSSLIENAKYYYRVRSHNAAGISSSSNIISVTTLPNEPPAPTATEAVFISATGFAANWNTVDGADGYYLDVAINPNFENKVSRYDNLDVGNVTKYDVTGLTENLVYYYRVRAYNLGGTSENSNTVSILVTKVEDTSYPADYKLFQNFPNPFNPTTTIEYTLKNDSQVFISVYNILGQEVTTLVNDYKRAGYHRLEFDGANLESGIYVYRIVAGNFTDVKRMMLLK